MKIISHRGNLYGRELDLENSPQYIDEAVKIGFDVEIDVWFMGGEFYLVHDSPKHKTNLKYLKNKKFWCHAKNPETLEALISNNVHTFWHDKDVFTITNKGIPLCHINYINKAINGSVVFATSLKKIKNNNLYGACVDNILIK